MPEHTRQQRPTLADLNSLDAIMQRANKGDPKAIARLRRFLDENPQVWQQVGDLARVAENAWIKLLANGCALTADATRRQLQELKQELLGESTTVVERMLADTVLSTWLELNYLRSVDADTRNRSVTQASLIIKRLESAQRRHHSAIKQLTQIRKLLPDRNAIPNLRLFPYRSETG
ncbi:hypothetical protein GYB59_16960 [bacterium]|nr:hypothetical protein [bacterium]